MLEQFHQNLEQMESSAVKLSLKQLMEAEKLLVLNEKLLMATSTKSKRPRNEEAIRDRMVTMMTRAGYERKTNKRQNVIKHFSAFVQSAKLQPDAEELEGEFRQWEKGKLSDNEMMLDVEQEVSSGAVDPSMLHDGETQKENAGMLEMDSTTHDETKDKVPMPIDAEQEADQYQAWVGDGALDNTKGKKRHSKACWPYCVSQPGKHPECVKSCSDPCKVVSITHHLTPAVVCAKCEKTGKENAHRSSVSGANAHAQCHPGALNFQETPDGEELWGVDVGER